MQLLPCQAPVVKCIHVLQTFIVGRFCVSLQAAHLLLPEPPHLKKGGQRFCFESGCFWRGKAHVKGLYQPLLPHMEGQGRVKDCRYVLAV